MKFNKPSIVTVRLVLLRVIYSMSVVAILDLLVSMYQQSHIAPSLIITVVSMCLARLLKKYNPPNMNKDDSVFQTTIICMASSIMFIFQLMVSKVVYLWGFTYNTALFLFCTLLCLVMYRYREVMKLCCLKVKEYFQLRYTNFAERVMKPCCLKVKKCIRQYYNAFINIAVLCVKILLKLCVLITVYMVWSSQFTQANLADSQKILLFCLIILMVMAIERDVLWKMRISGLVMYLLFVVIMVYALGHTLTLMPNHLQDALFPVFVWPLALGAWAIGTRGAPLS